MTRAKEHLHISYHASDLKGKDIMKSLYVSEIEGKVPVNFERISLSNEDIVTYAFQTLVTPIEIDRKFIELEFVKNKLKSYKLSVTHLSKYLKCPLTFYFENILQVPAARSPGMGFGNAIHYAMERLFKTMQDSGTQTFPPISEFVRFFNMGLSYNASHFTEKEYQLKVDYAKELLPEFYNFYAPQWHKVVVTEYRPSNVVMEHVPLSGALDKLEFHGNEVNVVDYKTGSPENISKKLKRPKEGATLEECSFEEVYGGDYWRQIVFYKILMDNDRTKNWSMTSGEVDFIEKRNSKEFKKEKITVTPDDIRLLKEQIHYTWDGIMSHQFTGCGKEDCQWCTFVKNNYKSAIAVDDEL